MGLETATYISGLTSSWPLAGDQKQQGDDHIRLIKATLQATFPSASKPWYFPSSLVAAANQTLTASSQNADVCLDTTAGSLNVTLPMLTSGDTGWECEVIKTSTDTNAILVSPASGSIYSKVGTTASIRVGQYMEPARFIWTGTLWICSKPGALIGSTENFDGATTPPGYMDLDGSTFSGTSFAELAAALGTTTVRDKRGRVEAGVDGGTGRLSATYFGASPVAGAVGGLESHTLTTAQLANHTHANVLSDPGHTHNYDRATFAGASGASGSVFGVNGVANTGTAATGITFTNVSAGGGGAHNNVQPTIVVKKIVRAC